MKGIMTTDEFKGPQPRMPRVNNGRDGTTNQRITPTPAPPVLSTKEFYVTVEGQPITFRQNLASWTDQQDRAREEHKFLEAVYNFDGNCKNCNRPGHRAVGCPDKFKLDPKTGQDHNPKWYFFTLVPLQMALDTALPIRRSRGAGNNRSGRGGSVCLDLAAALEAVNESTACMET